MPLKIVELSKTKRGSAALGSTLRCPQLQLSRSTNKRALLECATTPMTSLRLWKTGCIACDTFLRQSRRASSVLARSNPNCASLSAAGNSFTFQEVGGSSSSAQRSSGGGRGFAAAAGDVGFDYQPLFQSVKNTPVRRDVERIERRRVDVQCLQMRCCPG